MGRPAKSQAEHNLHSTRSHAGANQSHVPSGRPRFPNDVPKDARREFKRLCALLEERRVLSKGDEQLLRLYCQIWDRHKRNYAALLAEGEVREYTRLDSNGQPHQQVKENIRLKMVERAEKQMVAILVALGLTPTAKDKARPVTQPDQPELVPGTVAWFKAQAPAPAPVLVVPTSLDDEEESNGDEPVDQPV